MNTDLEAMVMALTESMNKLSQDLNEGFAQVRNRVQMLEEPRARHWTPDPFFDRTHTEFQSPRPSTIDQQAYNHGPHPNPYFKAEPRRTPYPEPNPRRATTHDPLVEANPRGTPHPDLPRSSKSSTYDPRAYRNDLIPDYDPRYPDPNFGKSEERPIRNTQPYAPTFAGSSNPEVYIDWEEKMDQYFECTNLSELGKVRLAKTKFTQHARSHWRTIEHECYHRGVEISTWRAMRSRLREKYLGRSYEHRLLDRWNKLRQDDRSVSNYIEDFQWYVMQCNINEPVSETIARFRDGLHRDIRQELFNWRICRLEEAYDIAREFESYQRELMASQSKSSRVSTSEHKPRPSQLPLDQPTPTVSLVHMNDRSKDPEVQVESTNIQDLGYPQIEKLGDKFEPIEDSIEEVYDAGLSLIDEYEGEELDECDIETIGSLPEETLESNPVIGPSSETQEICENQVPLVQYPQEELIVPAQAIIPYPLVTVIPQAPIEDLYTELSKSSHPMVDPFLRMTESSLLRLDLVSCLTSKVSTVISVRHPFLKQIDSSSPVGALHMTPDPFLHITDLPVYRVYLSSPVGQLSSFKVIIHRPFHGSFSNPFLEEADRYFPRDRTLTVETTCPKLLPEPYHDPFLGVGDFLFRKVGHLTFIGHHPNLQGTTFSQQITPDSTSYFLPFPRTSNASYTIQLNFIEVSRVIHYFKAFGSSSSSRSSFLRPLVVRGLFHCHYSASMVIVSRFPS